MTPVLDRWAGLTDFFKSDESCACRGPHTQPSGRVGHILSSLVADMSARAGWWAGSPGGDSPGVMLHVRSL